MELDDHHIASVQMQELKGRTLAFIAEKFAEIAALSNDLVGLADTLLSGLAKVYTNTAAHILS